MGHHTAWPASVESTVVTDREELAAYERQFRRSGLPLFIEDYSASEDVFTRAAPFLALVFVGEMLGAIELDWPLALNIVAAIGGLLILVCAFGVVNRLQGRRFLSLPSRIGLPELAAFVLLPALLPLIFGGQLRQVGGLIVGNSALLVLVYFVVGYGLLSTIFWALTRVAGELAASLGLLIKALPLLLVFSLVLFVNTEMWQVFTAMPWAFFVLVAGLFAGLGLLFLVLRVPGEVTRLEATAGREGPPLDRRQRANLGLTLVVSQMLQVLVVSAGIGAFFVAFGALAIGPEVREAWGVDDAALAHVDLLGYDVQITETLLRVSGGIAAITGLYYAISILTDSTYREEFLDGVVGELTGVFTARTEYLACRARIASADASGAGSAGVG